MNLKSDKGYYIDLECWNSALDKVEENDLIMVTGELDQNSWENKETGKRQYKFRVNVDACRNYGKEQTPF
ncbi:unnamed protein product [Leptospira phage LE1]|uniref:Single-stranded DNA-binding protein n=1 Tax=Leptospira phage LE1 TaxID=137511 RepID=Q6NDY0_9CAUD|nr:hypothetical protein HWD53_gp63 [Leptospira phage LE1]CAE14761.1 unnamed protein product [Leptospira phage LE1]